MIITDLSGKEYKFIFNKARGRQHQQSNLELRAKNIIEEIYPTVPLFEEVPLIVDTHKTLYFDFFLPLLKMIIECQGSQHYISNSYFYQNPHQFHRQKANDRVKREFCKLNKFHMVELRYDTSNEQWRDQLRRRENE